MFDFSSFLSNKAFITEDHHVYTYADLLGLSERFSEHLVPRSLIFIGCENSLESIVAYVSCLRSGVVPLLLSRDVPDETLYHLEAIYHPRYCWFPSRRDLLVKGKEKYSLGGYSLIQYDGDSPVLPEGLALLLTTSGSTGSPKLVRLSHDNLKSNACSIIEYLKITSSEKAITSLPMYYSYGLSVLNSHLLAGATLLLTDKSYVQREFWKFVLEEKATSFAGVPFTYEILKKMRFEKFLPSSVKVMTQAGGKLNSSLIKFFSEYARLHDIRFYVMYGQTEATARMSYLPAEYTLNKVGSVGVAIPGGHFSLIDEDGMRIVSPNVEGELVYEGSNVFWGYAESLDDLFKGDENKGILYTGDLAYVDSEGFYYISGRKKRFLKLYGNRISLDFVESIVKDHCQECACVGSDDKLIVYVTDLDKIDSIKSVLSNRVLINPSAYEVRFIGKIPRTDSGKIIYSDLSII